MATILPQGKTQFCDSLGNPLSGGLVYFYIPNTTTPKDTYQDADQTVLNANPVVLDAAGRGIIYGSGSYRQIVEDSAGNVIWDQSTSETAYGGMSFGGTSSGTADAQVISAGTFNGSDGSVITFIAGLSNTGPTTLTVGTNSPISILKNSGTGPTDLASGDIISGNIYSVVYSSTLAAFQLLQSIPPTITIASQAEAEAGTNNTNLMTPLRTAQAIVAQIPDNLHPQTITSATENGVGADGKITIAVNVPDLLVNGLSVAGVGNYCMVRCVTQDSFNLGSLAPGSVLRPDTAKGDLNNATLSGTWRILGAINGPGNDHASQVTLAQRVA